MLFGVPEGLAWGRGPPAYDSSYKLPLSADEVDAQRKEAIKAKVGERVPWRKWVRGLGATRDWLP